MIEFIQKVPLFSLLNQTQLEAIAQICTKKTIKANNILFAEKDPTLMQVIRDLEEKQILQISPVDFKLDLAKLR
jgi:hypothetical protein